MSSDSGLFTQPEAATLPRGAGGGSSTRWDILSNISGENGKPRLKHARSYFVRISQEDIPVLQEAFQIWRDYDEHMLLRGENLFNGEKVHVAVKCSKRGNDVFTQRLDRKLGFLRGFEGIKLFSLLDFQKCEYMPSNLLFVTLTYNPALCSMDEAWDKIGGEWNRFITNLRNKYGRILYLATPEAFPDPNGSAFGYPHIHVMMLFLDQDFNVFPNWEKKRDGKEGWVFRVKEKYEIESQGRWHSFVDMKAIHSGRAMGGYLRKHMKNTHGGSDPAALTTQAVLWLKKKQTFSMSSGFREAFNYWISHMQGSKTEAQSTLDGRILDDWIWSFHGVFSAAEVGADPGVWVVSLTEEQFHRLADWRGEFG